MDADGTTDMSLTLAFININADAAVAQGLCRSALRYMKYRREAEHGSSTSDLKHRTTRNHIEVDRRFKQVVRVLRRGKILFDKVIDIGHYDSSLFLMMN
jgi:hypothetical protein